MTTLLASTTDPVGATPPALPGFGELRSRFRGALLRPGEEGYEHARQVWNGAVDRRPVLIARCAGADDVRLAVRYVRAHGLPLTVRGGGHSVLGHGVADDAVMIDLSLLREVSVDPGARIARAGAGVTWAEFDQATGRHGLATTGGSLSSVGIAGVSLAGGFGHLMRRFGLTVDNLRGAELITADGALLRVDGDREPELLWGLRGGGGNFGVVTAFEYDVHQVGPLVLGGPIFWPLEQAGELLSFLRGFAPGAPDELGMAIVAMGAPPMPFLASAAYGTPVIGLVPVWSGDLAVGAKVLAPLLAVGHPLGEQVRPVPYRMIQSLLDGGASAGNTSYWRSRRLSALSDGAIDVIVSAATTLPTPMSLLSGWAIGGAVSRVAPEATAVAGREEGFELRLIANWRPGDPGADRHTAWVHEGWEALRPYGIGQYGTFLSDEGPDAVRSAFGAGYERLVALKDRYDPQNVFRHNVNIPPSVGTAEVSITAAARQGVSR